MQMAATLFSFSYSGFRVRVLVWIPRIFVFSPLISCSLMTVYCPQTERWLILSTNSCHTDHISIPYHVVADFSVINHVVRKIKIVFIVLTNPNIRKFLAVLFGIKGKAAPLQAWSGPECSRKLRFPDYMTTAQDGGKVVSLMHLPPLPPGNAPGTHFC